MNGCTLRNIRAQLNISQEDLARILRVSLLLVSEWEHDQQAIPEYVAAYLERVSAKGFDSFVCP